ncbi:hypothetical protein AAFF_G00229970 [Aldrovandia affinis]|uniref:Uncharacterized protein n=1 Tax=Aldrovandia affinis TaxID=143900 RepID=A0AAD7SXE8_9TELE|nr:hypothetical protein AAFF_G00229970 [Aldrovandia affinis]
MRQHWECDQAGVFWEKRHADGPPHQGPSHHSMGGTEPTLPGSQGRPSLQSGIASKKKEAQSIPSSPAVTGVSGVALQNEKQRADSLKMGPPIA